MVRYFRAVSATVLIVGTGLLGAQAQQANQSVSPGNKILAHALAVETGREAARPHEAHVSSGVMYPLWVASGALAKRAQLGLAPAATTHEGQGESGSGGGGSGSGAGGPSTGGCSNVFTRSDGERQNIRVNQDCSLRRQAEEVIVVNPVNPQNLLAGQNDSRIGFNHCGYDFSNDGGKTWGDMLPPLWQFILKDGHTADF